MLTEEGKKKIAEIEKMALEICAEMEREEEALAKSRRVSVPFSQSDWEEGRESKIYEEPVARACRKCIDLAIAKIPSARTDSVSAAVKGNVKIDGNSYGFSLGLKVNLENFRLTKTSFTFTRLLIDTEFKFDDFSDTYRLGYETIHGGRLVDRQIYGDGKKNPPEVAIRLLREKFRNRDLPAGLSVVARRMLQHCLNPKQGRTKGKTSGEKLIAAVKAIMKEEGLL